MSIQNELDQIKNAIRGHEVRGAIHDGIEKAYDDASKNGNANMEVSLARGNYPTLRERLLAVDNKQATTTSQLAQKADKSQIGAPNQQQVDDWLNRNPDATTTVADNSLTTKKYADQSITPEKTTFVKQGKNKFNGVFTHGAWLDGSGDRFAENFGDSYSALLPLETHTTYTVSWSEDTNRFGIITYDGKPSNNQHWVRIINPPIAIKSTQTFQTGADETYLQVIVSTEGETPLWLQVEKGDKATPFSDYDNVELNITFEKEADTFFVSPTGSDSNDGISRDQPFSTFQKAVDRGAVNIWAEPGDYYGQTVVARNRDKLDIKVFNDGRADEFRGEKDTARITNGRELSVVYESSRFVGSVPLDDRDNWREVFLNRTLPVINETPNPNYPTLITYNVILWQRDPKNDANTSILRPVLSLADLESGTFYYDGSTVTIYPTVDVPNLLFFKTIDMSLANPKFESIRHLNVSDVEFLFSPAIATEVYSVEDYKFTNCNFAFSLNGSGFRPYNSNGVCIRCYAHHNRIDGFAPIHKGRMDFIDCFGYYNGDDGISHHDYTTGMIQGGEYHHNPKGGVIPTQSTKVDIYNVISHNNKYGFNVRDGYGQEVNHIGNVAYDNQIGISVKGFKLKSFNCKYDNNITPMEVDVSVDTELVIL